MRRMLTGLALLVAMAGKAGAQGPGSVAPIPADGNGWIYGTEATVFSGCGFGACHTLAIQLNWARPEGPYTRPIYVYRYELLSDFSTPGWFTSNKIDLHAYWGGQWPQELAEERGILDWDVWRLFPMTTCLDPSDPCVGEQTNNEGGLTGPFYHAFEDMRPKYANLFVANEAGEMGTVPLTRVVQISEPSATLLLLGAALLVACVRRRAV
jgi:hypothetical protein